MPRIPLAPVVLALAAGVLAVPLPSSGATVVPGRVVVASANLHEGALRPEPRDRADARDLRRFVQRLDRLSPEPPDVVAVQEVRGSLGRVVRLLNARMHGRATYAAVTRPRLSRERGACGDRAGRFTVVRDGALVVNTDTTTVLGSGTVRTWGRWHRPARGVLRRADAGGCAEHPWARVRVAHDGVTRAAVVVGTHVGPLGHHLKTRALRTLADRVEAVAGAEELRVLAGDFNLPWCRGGGRVVAGCRAADGHEALAERGLGDALRSTGGDVGTRGRVDFIHSDGTVVTAGWDRCYRPAHGSACSRRESAYGAERAYAACHRRSVDHGRPGRGCGPAAYARYYSDHPVVTATVR